MTDSVLIKRLIDLRESTDMTQLELARQLGFDKSTMSRIEKGTRNITSDELLRFADYFNVSMDYLFGRDNSAHDYAPLQTKWLTLDLSDLSFHYRKEIKQYADYQRYRQQHDNDADPQ